jgi:hypothetical protein
MTCFAMDYQIAPNHNNVLGLTLITNLVDANSVPFIAPRGFVSSTRGERRVASNGTSKHAGFISQTWLFGYLTVAQYEYLKNTYEEGAIGKGLVTIRTSLNGITYANYNAILYLPSIDSLTTQTISRSIYSGNAFTNIAIEMSRLNAIL